MVHLVGLWAITLVIVGAPTVCVELLNLPLVEVEPFCDGPV